MYLYVCLMDTHRGYTFSGFHKHSTSVLWSSLKKNKEGIKGHFRFKEGLYLKEGSEDNPLRNFSVGLVRRTVESTDQGSDMRSQTSFQ